MELGSPNLDNIYIYTGMIVLLSVSNQVVEMWRWSWINVLVFLERWVQGKSEQSEGELRRRRRRNWWGQYHDWEVNVREWEVPFV